MSVSGVEPVDKDWILATAKGHSHPRDARDQLIESDRRRFLQDVANCVCGKLGVDTDEFYSSRRPQYVVRARHAFSLIAYHGHDLYDFGYQELGRFLGDRDHTTIISSRQRALDLCLTDHHYEQRILDAFKAVRQRGHYISGRKLMKVLADNNDGRREKHWSLRNVGKGD